MTQLSDLQTMVLRLAKGGIAAAGLRREVMLRHPTLTDSKYLSTLLALQDQHRLIGAEVTGVWVFTAVAEEDIESSKPEYSPQFAEMITAADCGNWQKIDPDEMIAELDAMIKKAQARKRKRSD